MIKTLLLGLALAALSPILSQAAPLSAPLSPVAVLSAAKTIQVTGTVTEPGHSPQVLRAQISLPNLARVDDQMHGTVFVSDGKTEYNYSNSRKFFVHSDADATVADMGSGAMDTLNLDTFLDPKAFPHYFHPAGTAALNGLSTAFYTAAFGGHDGRVYSGKLWVNAKTHLPIRAAAYVTQGGKTKEIQRIDYAHWVLNQPLDPALFAWTPPATAKIFEQPRLLAAGAPAPDFTVQDKDGSPVKLSDYAGKIVVLDFWATWCGPCQMSLPHTNKVAQENKDKDVVVLAVNVWDTKDAFEQWLPAHAQFDALHFAIDPATDASQGVATALYGVSGIPTQYVIGKDGKIVKSIVGYDEGSTDLETALQAAGAGS